MHIYKQLFRAFGPQHWWPAKTPEEVMFGAILAQNTSWKNVEQAILALKEAGLLSFRRIMSVATEELARLIRPARFMNLKAKALQNFATYFYQRYRCSITRMRLQQTELLRHELLGLYRIGPETADSILLYALEKPVFVIDVYTKRIMSRHGYLSMAHSYEEFQSLFMQNLPADVHLYNEYHALLVRLGNQLCKPRPLCEACPLKDIQR
ncbi:MAG: endonuclease III domain-containing protein [Desulfobacterota bacterium]|nr:endonuclease III domain-containing protein [Thermodesulfobacteriota bacterium]